MRLSHVPFVVAVLAVASTATAHSWQFAGVTGTIDPTTVHCDEHACTATLRAERVQLQDGSFDRREDAITVTLPARAALGGNGETWPDPRSALTALGAAPVRARGEIDWIDGHGVLTAERIARVSPSATIALASQPVFPVCGQPPWSQATLRRCFSLASRERTITVSATLATDADAEAPLRGGSGIAWLDLDEVRVDEMGIALAAPADHETAIVRAVKRLDHPTAARPSLRTLRAGDRLTLKGVYVLPVPGNLKDHPGARCTHDRCWPELVVESVSVNARR